MIKVAVVGAAGRMGSTVCDAVEGAADMQLVARIDAGDDISSATLQGADVAVEFTVPGASLNNVLLLLDAGVNVVVGTTGWNDESLALVRRRAEEVGRGVLIAPNFGLSAVLLMSFARQAARYFESAEVIELHHPNKVDAPSGTATTTAREIAAARTEAGLGSSPDATETDPLGARGASIDGVHVHAVRLRGLNAHEEVVFGNPGEQLVLRQDSFDRTSFMPGVLLAIRGVGKRVGLTYGLDELMGLGE
ncbi:4-hydroxy-tetrahydrodipicolinate reductase [Arcanobacterium haemolyticum]|nr:4-hydroxy-tetrahydrodipicolinate reductase [Arcanobacterium haemolyticum]